MGRSKEAQEIIDGAQRWSFAAGLVPVPWVDAAAVTYIQVEMIKKLCGLYGVPYRESGAKALVTSLVGSLLPTALGTNVARVAVRHLPGIGALIATLSLPTTLAGSTGIVGKLVAQHFEAGGGLADFGLKVRGAAVTADPPAAEPPAAEPAAEPEPEPVVTETPREVAETPDDLTAINGVGPKIAELLHAAGLKTFSQVAASSPEALRRILVDAGRRYRAHDPSSWPAQAASL